eukprot:TRINITY_DN6769_c0_g1_i1.p1 TRINITY_DN6769_c0_g1~~TRINITY_DN6769_c0_g1_i1.p1  ORF type:complete len:343 (-),score=86.76 TRINITY_DN6769_c0_g1_i1:234-1262(-)
MAAAVVRAKWQEVTNQDGAPKARSSHACVVIDGKLYVFGGEFEPRVPIDNNMHVLDIEARTWSVAPSHGQAPAPRVGVTMAVLGKKIFVFGGRDTEHEELNEFFSFDTSSGEWTLLTSGDTSPPNRSYHAMVANEQSQKLYVFGGCGKAGRLNDLWQYDVSAASWQCLPAPPPGSTLIPRGGPGLAAVGDSIWVVFGFSGKEQSDVHRFDLKTQTWQEVDVKGKEGGKGAAQRPAPRSVFSTAVLGKCILLYGGEVDPSDLGHMGAGNFIDDVWLLDTEKEQWVAVVAEPESGKPGPGARGWYAAAEFGSSMLVYGGNSDTNDRLDDMFVLTVESDLARVGA